MISNFGGLAGLLFKVFLAVAGYIDEKLLFSKFIRSLYFKKTQVKTSSGGHKHKIVKNKFLFLDNFADLREYL